MEVKDIKKLLDAIDASQISEFVLETGDYKLTVKRQSGAGPPSEGVVMAQGAAREAGAASAPASAQEAPPPSGQPVSPAGPIEPQLNLVDVTAPIVGTFYSAPSPDAPPFVKVGDRVRSGQVLCIIEAMKLMNEIEAEAAGTVVEILVRNEEPVEYGQVLFRIEPG